MSDCGPVLLGVSHSGGVVTEVIVPVARSTSKCLKDPGDQRQWSATAPEGSFLDCMATSYRGLSVCSCCGELDYTSHFVGWVSLGCPESCQCWRQCYPARHCLLSWGCPTHFFLPVTDRLGVAGFPLGINSMSRHYFNRFEFIQLTFVDGNY